MDKLPNLDKSIDEIINFYKGAPSTKRMEIINHLKTALSDIHRSENSTFKKTASDNLNPEIILL